MGRSNREVVKRPQPITDRSYKFTFGKWINSTIEEVITTEPQYLVWLHDTSERFELSAELLREAEGQAEDFSAFREERRSSVSTAKEKMTIRDVYEEFKRPVACVEDDGIPF